MSLQTAPLQPTTPTVYYNMTQNQIPNPKMPPTFGEILTSNQQTQGTLQAIDEFKGRKLLGISGGYKRIFLFEEVDQNENVVTALHPENQDQIKYKDQVTVNINEVVQSLEGFKIAEIVSGKCHNVIRTQEGHIFAYGKGQFGSLGLGGSIFTARPRLLTKLENKKIIAVACGAYHTLALSSIGDLYSWGRGFEGQLGLLQNVETAASPQYVTHFYRYDSSKEIKMLRKKPVHKIACGAYHSIAIDNEGQLYTWGEAISGATGTGLKVKEPRPVKIDIKIGEENQKVVKISGGFSHTLCLTQKGDLFSWGLNAKGQIGINDIAEKIDLGNNNETKFQKVVLYPVQLKYARDKTELPKFVDINCGFSRSFAIDEESNVWGWGGGCLGFKDKFSQRGPTKLTQGTDNKKFSKIYANQNSLLIFSPFCPTYFKPALISSKGATQMTFFGTGFTNTGAQSIIFKIGENQEEIKLEYDEKTCTFYCKAVIFDEWKIKVKQPVQCELSITLDGKKYFNYSQKLLVYPQKLALESIQPKAGSALGSSDAKIYMPLHPLIQSYTETITVGFKNNGKNSTETQKRGQDWICVQGHYEDDKIFCKLPNIPSFNNEDPFYLVDVSLNGQEFTNHPQTIRFYLISDVSMIPNQGIQTQENVITINGKGLFDTPAKELTVQLSFNSQGNDYHCIKSLESQWIKNERKFTFKMPTLQWLLGDININDELLSDARKNSAVIKLNLSKKQAIQIGKYKFTVPPPPEIPPEQTNKKDSKNAKKGAKK